MGAALWAVLTALCWAVGSYMEKKGVKLGNFTPVMGTALRTFVSLIFLGLLSIPYWGQVKEAGVKPILLIAIGGGIIAGGLGVLFLYTGLKTGQLTLVLTIAFCLTPVFGAILGFVVMHDKLSVIQVVGIVLCITGAALAAFFKNSAPVLKI